MKYLVILCDGMSDEPVAKLDNKTPMECACKPCMDALAQKSLCGTMITVPDNLVPESSTANLAVMGYDPQIFSKGRSPLEAMSMGLDMSPEDVAFRCNVVTLSEDEPFEEKIMIDHSAGEISTKEADALIRALDQALGTDTRHFYTGISYRHCMIWSNPPAENEAIYDFSRPHDFLGQKIKDKLPHGKVGDIYRDLYLRSYEILNVHPVNLARIAAGKRPANCIWLWSAGKKPAL
ncbi:MAG TPA: phosphoglycerate mutase, partial [Clostridiales bacterium]|nr:phosphoglycerate mutase [Clostridiales bacterium]